MDQRRYLRCLFEYVGDDEENAISHFLYIYTTMNRFAALQADDVDATTYAYPRYLSDARN